MKNIHPLFPTELSKAKNTLDASAVPTASNDYSGGYSKGSLWYYPATLQLWILLDSTIGSADWFQIEKGALNNYTATTAPTVNEDSDDGYSVGSKWYDTTGDESYICLDATVGAAVWQTTSLTIDDLGSMATQDADAVAITGGSIDNTPIGGTTPAAGSFSSVTDSSLTESELIASDGSKNLQSLAVATYPSLTEVSYVKGVTSAIQTQLDAKEGSLGFTPEDAANKATDFTTVNDTLYPSVEAVNEQLALKQDILAEGAFVDGDKSKLDGIETAADVTDTTNVTAAGALMDSELTNIADVKALEVGTTVQAYDLVLDEIASQTITADATTQRTLALTDSNDYIRFTSASDVTVTLPLNSSVAFETGTRIDLFRAGAGNVTVAATGGVTINKAEGLKIAAQYKGATLIKVGTDEWDLIGALAA